LLTDKRHSGSKILERSIATTTEQTQVNRTRVKVMGKRCIGVGFYTWVKVFQAIKS